MSYLHFNNLVLLISLDGVNGIRMSRVGLHATHVAQDTHLTLCLTTPMTGPLWKPLAFPSPPLSGLGMMGLHGIIHRYARTIWSIHIQFDNPPSTMQALMTLNSHLVYMISRELPLEAIIAGMMAITSYTHSLITIACLMSLPKPLDWFLL